jgi:hypothetical protein
VAARILPSRVIVAVALLLAIAAALIGQRIVGTEQASGAKAITKTSGSVKLATKSFQMTRADEERRLVVRCPGRLVPLGGGMVSDPPPGPDGEGVYAQSYERLGVQRGWHVTALLFDPSRGNTTTRNVTMQVKCARKQKHVTPPHTTVFLSPGQTKTIRATCHGRRHLFGGGFQRTNLVSRGGAYATEARAISSKAWQVTGSAFGDFGGELTAIGYCRRSKKPLLSEVSASTRIQPREFAWVTTPPCPGNRKLVFGGFNSSRNDAILIADGRFNPDNSWSGSAVNHFGGGSVTFIVYGYCLKV